MKFLFDIPQYQNLVSLSFNDKILFILNDLFLTLNPVEGEQAVYWEKQSYYHPSKRKTFAKTECVVEEFERWYFEQIQVNVTKEKIKITWDKGEYEFPPDMFLITQERFKKAAGACKREEQKKPITIQNKKQKPVTLFEIL